jgi:hypothetical protein
VRPARIIALGLVLALATGACSSGGDGPKAKPGVAGTRAVRSIPLTLVGADIVSPARALAPLGPDTTRAALAALQRTFDATVVRPMVRGKGGSIAADFTSEANGHAVFVDRAAMYDEGLPPVTAVVATKAEVRLTALAGEDDRLALIVAAIDWDVRSADRRVRVHRVGELSLVPVYDKLLVAAYTVYVDRTVAGATTSTSAKAGP